jgi:hydrogenase maturation factor HypF (carbamoyltransferase family)
LTRLLQDADFEVFRHRRVSCNDEGISFGQTAIAEKGNPNVSCSTTETY